MPASRAWFEKDFYEVLGVGEQASADELKRAYKKLARELHPDKNKATGAEERFKDVSEAYDVLSDPEQRREYDEVRRLARQGYVGGTPGAGFQSGVRFEDLPFDIGDLFGFSGGGARRGGARRQRVHIEPEPPREERRTVRVPYHVAALGGQIRVPTPAGQVTMKLAPGTQPGATMRLRGKGSIRPDGRPGDLIVQIQVTIPTTLDDEERALIEKIASHRADQRRAGQRQADQGRRKTGDEG